MAGRSRSYRMHSSAPLTASYDLRVSDALPAADAAAWDALLQAQSQPTPFMRHAYLAALQASGSAVPATGWTPLWFTLWQGGALHAACVLYLKPHSRGEYVFDWAWADAYARHGLPYYPKAVVAVPFTPVPGTRLLARDAAARLALLRTLVDWCDAQALSSLHLLFTAPEDVQAAREAGLMLRHGVQFHWNNAAPPSAGTAERPLRDFDDFLAARRRDHGARLGLLLPLLRAHLRRARQPALPHARLLHPHGRLHARGMGAVRGRARRAPHC
jgi:predicted N-acyltransferase